MARASSSSSCSSSTRLLLIAAACAVLALAWAPGVRATGVEDRDPGVAQKDALEMHPTLMLEELPHSGSGGGVAGGVRKLLGWSKKKYVVSWGSDGYGNYNKGYMQCQPPYKWAKSLNCYGTKDKWKATPLWTQEWQGKYQIAMYGTSWCMQLYTQYKVQVALGKCEQPSYAPWQQRWNVYKSYSGETSIRTGPKKSDWAVWWPGYGKPMTAQKECDPADKGGCGFAVAGIQ